MNRNSMGSSQSNSRRYEEQTLIPVTIRMMLNATPSPTDSGNLSLRDGREIHQVKFVGAVRGVDEQSTNASFQIEDGTGLMEVKQWVNTEDCRAVTQMRMEASVENIYVRIVGQMKDYDGRKSVMAHSVRRISTGNELTHHMLEVVYSFERYKRGGIGASKGAMPQSVTPYGGNMQSGGSYGGGMGGGQAFTSNNSMGGQMGMGGNMPNGTDLVRRYIKTEGDKSDIGADVNMCKKYFENQLSPSDVDSALAHLASEGHIYSTVDETKFKSAE